MTKKKHHKISGSKNMISEEVNSLKDKLAIERYISYLSRIVDGCIERYPRDFPSAFSDIAMLLQAEWDIDGIFIVTGDYSLSHFINAYGNPVREELTRILHLSARQCIDKRVAISEIDYESASPSLKQLSSILDDILVIPLYQDSNLEKIPICVIGIYRATDLIDQRRDVDNFVDSTYERKWLSSEDRTLVKSLKADLRNRDNKLGHVKMVDITERVMESSVDNAVLFDKIRREDLEHHVGQSFTSKLMSDPNYISTFTPRLKLAGYLFADIVGFSAFARERNNDSSAVVSMLNNYFTLVQGCIDKTEGALLDKYIGDCLVILIGALDPPSNESNEKSLTVAHRTMTYARRGVILALKLVRVANEMDISVSAGFHVGKCHIGYIGPNEDSDGKSLHKDFTAIGDAMNISARLQQEAIKDEVLVSKFVFNTLKEDKSFIFSNPKEISIKNMGNEYVYTVTNV